MKVVFFGTPEYAVKPLQALIDSCHEVVAVVTQPDKAVGRSNKIVPTPVKKVAIENNIPVIPLAGANAALTGLIASGISPQPFTFYGFLSRNKGELKEELECYEDDMELVFELEDDVEVDTVTESRYGWREVHIDSKLEPTFISTVLGDMRIELGVKKK